MNWDSAEHLSVAANLLTENERNESLFVNEFPDNEDESEEPCDDSLTLEEIRQAQSQFVKARDWEQFHTPRNLVMALVGEVGELAEIFQWKGEVKPGLPEFKAEERVHLGEEISDVLLYLIRLADVCGVNVSQAVTDKIQKNARKYPADKCRGSCAKYTTLGNSLPSSSARPREVPGIVATPAIPSSVAVPAAVCTVLSPSSSSAQRMSSQVNAAHSPNKSGSPVSQTGNPGSLGASGDTLTPCFTTTSMGSADDASKRKRFKEDQLEALTDIAEQYNWSLSSVTHADRKRLMVQYCITKERMQNFFNNRKPKEMKRLRPSQTLNPSSDPTLSHAPGASYPVTYLDLSDPIPGNQPDVSSLTAAAESIVLELQQHVAAAAAGSSSMQALLNGGSSNQACNTSAPLQPSSIEPVSSPAVEALTDASPHPMQHQPLLMVPGVPTLPSTSLPMVMPGAGPPQMLMDMQQQMQQQMHHFQMMHQQHMMQQHMVQQQAIMESLHAQQQQR
ncbi:hypothetical protein CEUSTIGMA_g10594.t1 [Chlamydomonas eustigma]|uniref:Uncharacterized protein n=1 Tax=Chlamydomonas eustigma TaxID=1157962 RepID=A0A250XJC1_9CHLO|nr:hypothetical protein CEUSTIGMA_g10594.t1 [Chlamydomonas eustigma]|eukprot:GAX83168.1 hypothetical protein CEUSTIGMA_g10594.t1 [Chlamydomonas eustigma]